MFVFLQVPSFTGFSMDFFWLVLGFSLPVNRPAAARGFTLGGRSDVLIGGCVCLCVCLCVCEVGS